MNEKIAIVGMAAVFGSAKNLNAFAQYIYDCNRQSRNSSPDNRNKAGSPPKNACASNSRNSFLLTQEVIKDAKRDTQSIKAADPLNEAALLVVSDTDASALNCGYNIFRQADSFFRALEAARDLLVTGKIKTVIIAEANRLDAGCEVNFDEETAAAAVLLKLPDQARKDNDRVYAVIEAMGVAHSLPDSDNALQPVAEVIGKTLAQAGVKPSQVAYLEILNDGSGKDDLAKIKAILQAYRSDKDKITCALGSLKNSVDLHPPEIGIAGLIKSALCLYLRFIPAARLPGLEHIAANPFYLASESRTWFPQNGVPKRIAALNSIFKNEIAHLVMSEPASPEIRSSRYLSLSPPYCFPLSGNTASELIKRLSDLQSMIAASLSLPEAAQKNFAAYSRQTPSAFALAVVGQNKEEVQKEIQFMIKAVPDVFAKRGEWKTPAGSYFTAEPLGVKGKVAFVYPGVGSPYLGMGQDIFHLFPELYGWFSRLVPDIGGLLKEESLYPRSLKHLSDDQIKARERLLRRDIMAISECGMGFSVLFTMIFKDIFKVTPDCALGYSLGEAAMMASLGVWRDPGQLSGKFRSSPTFRQCLHKELSAVRKYWNLKPYRPDNEEIIWESYTLLTSPDIVGEAIRDEAKVFLTLINTPNEVVIAGDPESCLRVIESLGCKYYPLHLDLAIHSGPTRLEYDRLTDLYTLPLADKSAIKFYSSSCYKAIPIRSKSVAHTIAQAFCHQVDFPRLVNQVYEHGARIFIELGPRQACSLWIDEILKHKEHIAVPVNIKGVKDKTAVSRALTRLIGHRVPLDLSPLF